MKNIEIRTAAMEELPEILQVFEYARGFMAANGNPTQWGNAYPPVETLAEDIEKGQLYIAVHDGSICGAFVFFLGGESDYVRIDGQWSSDDDYGTIHRVASNGTVPGVFAACIDFCGSKCRYLRIDTHENNKVMQHVVTKQGFSYCGIIYLRNGDPRLAYDRVQKNLLTR